MTKENIPKNIFFRVFVFILFLGSKVNGTEKKTSASAGGLAEIFDHSSTLGFRGFCDELRLKTNGKRDAKRPLNEDRNSDQSVPGIFKGISSGETNKKGRGENYSMTGNWGAVGMPFNVLYTPNSRQQKMMKFTPAKLSGSLSAPRPVNRTPVRKLPRVFYLLLDDRKSSPRSDEKTLKRPHLRKYYSFIPQLFVSYGW